MNEIEKQTSTPLALTQEKFEKQMELFVSKGMEPSMAFSHELIPIGDGKYKLIKRDDPIDIIDFDIEGNASHIAYKVKSAAELIGIDKPRANTKFGDEQRLIDQDTASLEVGEIESWEVH